jgi:predicted nucleic acid-binding protein
MDLDMVHGAIVLVDSSALVYLVEGKSLSPRRAAVERFFAEAETRGTRLVASTFAWTELLEGPLARGEHELAAAYRRLLADSSRIALREVDVSVAETAAELAAAMPNARRRTVSSGDLLHIATAIATDAAAILTNDEAWRSVPRCPPLVLVDELAAEIGEGE